MSKRVTVRKVSAKELSPMLRRRFNLVPDEQVSITVTRRNPKKASRWNDPWNEIRGTLLPHEADEMVRAIHLNRRSKSGPLELDAP